MMVWTLSDSSRAGVEAPKVDSAPNTEPARPSPIAEPTTPAGQPQPTAAAPAAVPDLFAGSMPDFMIDVHRQVLGKQPLEVEQQKQLYEFGRAHKDDARPQLLLAWDSMNNDWDGIAVRMYRMAYNADKRAKDDPSMLRDLLEVASRNDHVEFDDARKVIGNIYGAQALPALNAKLQVLRAQGKFDRTARLEHLRNALQQPQ